MKKFLLAGVALTSLLGGSAAAADLAVKARRAEPVFTWTGCYGGVNAGYAWKRTHYDVGFDPAFAFAATPNRYDINPEGALAGIQAGCNYQFGQFVIGIEGDYDWGNVEDKKQLNTAALGFLPGFGTASEQLRELGTLRGRIGVAIDRLLLYATAGGAWGRTRYNYSFTDTLFQYTAAVTSTRSGWTAGAGGEYAFSNYWSLKAEALYFRLNGASFVAPEQTGFAAIFPPHVVTAAKDTGWTFRLGLNYRFGGYGGVVAAY